MISYALLVFIKTTHCLTDFAVSKTPVSDSDFWAGVVASSSSFAFDWEISLPAPRIVFEVTPHGQKYIATIVKVVSMEFENVLVEQNQFQGLSVLIII